MMDGWRSFLAPEDVQPIFAHLERKLNSLAQERGELALTIPAAYVEGIKNGSLPNKCF
jgi:hypothetical protein